MLFNHTSVAIALIEKGANVKRDLIRMDYVIGMMIEKETGSEEVGRGGREWKEREKDP
jgi:hypothetical protein